MSASSLRPLFLLTPLALAILGGLSGSALGADPASISGHVLSTGAHRPLVGVSVQVEGTALRASSDTDGTYQLGPLAPGQYTVLISVDGVERARRTVTVADQPVTQDFEVDGKVYSLQTVQVLAQRTPASVARAAQQDAANLVNLTTAEEIRKLPDVSAAEAIRRIPGISLETDTGEGRYINIRGLDADLNSTTFGGLRLPPSNNASPFGGGRAVAYDAIPTGLIGAITVTKTNLPEQDAEALGGTIDITPKTTPLSGKPFLEGHIGTGEEMLRHSGIKDFSLTAGTRFGGALVDLGQTLESYSDKPFSVVATASYYEDRRGIDDLEAAYIDNQAGGVPDKAFAALEQRYYNYHRTRHGYGLDLGFQPNANHSFYLRAFDAGYTETVNRQRLILNFDGNPVSLPGGALSDTVNANGFDKTLRDEKEKIGNRVIALGGKSLFGDKTLDYRAGYTRGTYNKLYDLNSDFNYTPATPATVTYNNASDPNFPSYSIVGANPFNAANYTLAGLNNSVINIVDEERSYAANLKIPTHYTDYEGEQIKVGGSSRVRSRRLDNSFYHYTNLPALSLASADGSGTGVGYYDNHYSNGPNIDEGVLRSLAGGASGVTQTQTLNDIANGAQAFALDREDVYALYGQYEFGYGKWSFIGGARVERTHASYAGNNVVEQTDANGGLQAITSITPAVNTRDYNNFFPSLQGRYAFNNDLIGRLAVSTTIARPGFNQATASTNVDTATNSVVQGNPNLKPTTAVSFDASIEQYLPHAGIMSAGVFDKELSDYIVGSKIGSFPNSGQFQGITPGIPVFLITYANTSRSYARGLELNYEARYRELGGVWGGLGTSANYTFVDSDFEIRPGEHALLPSTSRNTANLALFYEKDGFNVRVGVYYVSRNLFAIGGSAATDVFSEPRTSVDLGTSYAIDKNLTVYFNAKNLSNTALKFTEGSDSRPIQREFYGVTLQTGLQINY